MTSVIFSLMDKKSSLNRIAFGWLAIWINIGFVTLYLFLEYSSVSSKIYLPYRYGAFVISIQFIYIFAFCNTFHCFRRGTFVEHAFYAGVILVGLFVGTYFNKPGCTNISIVWTAFWIVTTFFDFVGR